MNLRNPLANARNHGAAGSGVEHWWAQRFSAILMLALAAWVAYALTSVIGASHADVSVFLARPFNAALAIVFIVTSLYHSRLGLQVVIEDYIHHRGLEMALLVFIKLAAIVGGALAVFAILNIAFGA